jgi:hypothetical protein
MKGKFRISLFIISALMINGCSTFSMESNVDILSKSSKAVIGNSFYLIYPKNGFQEDFITHKQVENQDSAKEVVKIFRDRFFKTFGSLTVGDANTDLEKGLQQAKLNGSNYLINIEIAEWKDASYFACKCDSTGRLMSKDSVDLTISVYDVAAKTIINKQRLVGNGCPTLLLYIPIGKSNPEDYLSPLLDEWMKSI